MFLPRISQPDCAAGWLAASQAVYAQPKHEAHHVVIDINDPVGMSDPSQAVVSAVDDYLGQHSETGFLVRTRRTEGTPCAVRPTSLRPRDGQRRLI
jgi:hypothetical protein